MGFYAVGHVKSIFLVFLMRAVINQSNPAIISNEIKNTIAYVVSVYKGATSNIQLTRVYLRNTFLPINTY